MLFNIVFANNTFLICFFFIFLIIDLHLLISTVTADLAMSIGRRTKEAKPEIEAHPLTAEARISKCST